jgi:hypothetical protein
VTLQAGDRVVLRTKMSEILGLQQNPEVRLVDKLSSVATTTVEVLITPGCRMIGRSLGSMRLRRRYGVYPLAVHRRNQNIGRQLDDLVVQVGDTLLLEGAPEDIQRLAADMDLVDINQPSERAYRRGHAPIVIGVLAAVVLRRSAWPPPIMRSPSSASPSSCSPAASTPTRRSVHRRPAAGADLRDAGRRRGAGPSGAVRADRGLARARG